MQMTNWWLHAELLCCRKRGRGSILDLTVDALMAVKLALARRRNHRFNEGAVCDHQLSGFMQQLLALRILSTDCEIRAQVT